MTKDITQHLSIKDKVKLFKELYTELSGYGCDGDTELAHINPYEAKLLKSIGGSGTVNQITGLREYKGGGRPPPPPPATQAVTQQTEFPEELKPFIKDVLGKAQAIQQKRESEGYIPFEGPQIASFTPEQEQAFTGISGLVGQGGQYFDPATRLAAASAIAPRQAEVEQFMSPYMQNVVEIQQREAQRQADVAAQQLGAQAVGAGGFGGSRQAILEAEQQRNLQQQLGDIQARGLAAAYEDAQRRIAEQRGRELAASGQFMQLGQVAPQQQQRELTALEAVGAQRQAQSQRGLDIARQQFQEEQTFPERTLQQYQSVIRGFPLAPTTYQTSQTTTPAPSFLQQAAGLGTTAIGLAGAFGGFRNARTGGKVDPNSGLGSIVVKKRIGGNFQQAMAEAAQRSALETDYSKDLFIKLLNREIDPREYIELKEKYRDSAMAEMPEEADIDPKFLASRTIPKNRGTAMSPLQARIAAQEIRAGIGGADQPITPSRETEEIAREQARARQLADVSRMLGEREAAKGYDIGLGFKPSLETEEEARRLARANQLANVSGMLGEREAAKGYDIGLGSRPSLETEEIARQQARAKQLADVSGMLAKREDVADDRFTPQAMLRNFNQKTPIGSRIAKPSPIPPASAAPSAPMLAGNIPTIVSADASPELDPFSREAMLKNFLEKTRGKPTSATPAAPQEAAVAKAAKPVVVDETPSSAEMAGMREGLKDFTPSLIADQDEAPSVISTQIETLKVNKPAAEKTITSFGKEISDLRKTLDERAEKKRTTAQRRKDSIERDKFLAVAQMGLNILAQDGGQTFLQAIGKGSKNIIPTLMKLSREELEVAENLDDLDFETAKAKLGLSEAEFNRYVKQRTLDIAEREATTKRLIAEGKVGKEGAPLSMAMLQGYARSITGLPSEALGDNKFLTDLAVASREDAIKSLRESGRGALVGDTGTVQSEQIRQIQLNPEKYVKLYGKTLPNKMGSGAPAGNIPPRPSADDKISNIQKRLLGDRTSSVNG